MTDRVTIVEMGPRDGLQNEKQVIATADKIRLVDLLSDCGFARIEVTSFVSPKWVPQLADAAQVLAGIDRHPGTSYAALTPNLQGFEAALAAGADEVAVFASASEGFSRANINCSILESFERFAPVMAAAKRQNIKVRGYVSCATDCPFDGPTPPGTVAWVAESLFRLGCYEISLGDTIGHGTPDTVARMLEAVLDAVPARQLAGHFHDTRGRALENIETALSYGLRAFDAAVAGLGGCPYAPGAAGNVPTEAVVALMQEKDLATGIDAAKLAKAADFARALRRPE